MNITNDMSIPPTQTRNMSMYANECNADGCNDWGTCDVAEHICGFVAGIAHNPLWVNA